MEKRIAKGPLKSRLLEVLREVEATGERVVVTDRGRPTAVISPYRELSTVAELFADAQGAVTFVGDPDEPTLGEWADA